MSEPDAPTVGRSDLFAVASRYGWMDRNRMRGFETWEQEIAHVESLGYTLVPPDYHIPHWSAQFSKDGPPPKLYVLRNDGPDEMRSSFDCPAARLGYPVFFKANDHCPSEGAPEKP